MDEGGSAIIPAGMQSDSTKSAGKRVLKRPLTTVSEKAACG